jgi:DNA-directed RNA polymerase subunit omega
MAQEGFDTLINLTDSRYRLSMIVARRAAQLKLGIPPALAPEDYPKTRNTVTLAMRELEEGNIVWGDKLPPVEELQKEVEREKREEQISYTVSRRAEDEDEADADIEMAEG